VRRPYRVRPHIVLFGTTELAQDWERIKGAASEAAFGVRRRVGGGGVTDALFEDMVAARLETLRRQRVQLGHSDR
jgi:hypothetical protein